MSVIKDIVFGPMQPKINQELLPAAVARTAVNLRHISGAMQPWRLPEPVDGMSMPGTAEIGTIYRFGKATPSDLNYWFQFPGDVDIVKGPVNSDTEEKTYWTDGAYPKKTKSSLAGLTAGVAITPTSLRMGVPPPGFDGPDAPLTFTPVATVSGTATDPESTPTTSTYIVTYLTTWDEESSPSNASNVVVWRAGQSVSLTLPGVLSGAYSIDRVRIYRSATGTNRTTFQHVTDKTVASETHDDTAGTDDLGEVCPTFDWNPPPDGLIGLTDMGNGMLAGFTENTVMFCEPNYPYAWPAKYDVVLGAKIVGMKSFGQTLVVGTTEGLVLVSGTDPISMSTESPKGSQACVSKRSMVEMLGGVVYASPDGLILVSPGGVQNLTEAIVTRDEWMSVNPASFKAYTIDGRYHCFYDTGVVQAGAILSFGNDAGLVLTDQFATAAYNEYRSDVLYMVTRDGTTNTLQKWDDGENMDAVWRGKTHRFHGGVLMARARVIALAYPVTYRLYSDDVLKYTKTVTDDLPFPLPDGRSSTIAHEVEANTTVYVVMTGTSGKEMGDV